MVPENRAKKYKNLFKSMSKIKSMKIGSEGVAVVLDMRMVSFMKANAIDQFHRSFIGRSELQNRTQNNISEKLGVQIDYDNALLIVNIRGKQMWTELESYLVPIVIIV